MLKNRVQSWCQIAISERNWSNAVPPRSSNDLCLLFCRNRSSMECHSTQNFNSTFLTTPGWSLFLNVTMFWTNIKIKSNPLYKLSEFLPDLPSALHIVTKIRSESLPVFADYNYYQPFRSQLLNILTTFVQFKILDSIFQNQVNIKLNKLFIISWRIIAWCGNYYTLSKIYLNIKQNTANSRGESKKFQILPKI